MMGSRAVVVLLVCGPLLLPACTRVKADRLYALPAGGGGIAGVVTALPLELKAGGGHVGGALGRFTDLDVDTDAVHKVSASCHHGPPITNPVPVEVRAFYDQSRLFLEVTWRDRTADRVPLRWERSGSGWRLGDADEDGVAILWSGGAGKFGCQEACHMSDFAVRAGTVIDLRAMYLVEPGAWEEAWVWKSAGGARELLLGNHGFVTIPGGEVYRKLNSVAAADESLRPGARRAGAFGAEDRPRWDVAGGPLPPGAQTAPAYLYAPREEAGLLSASAERRSRGWRVLFSRPLDAGPGRQSFRRGERYRFGLAIFDSTSTDHHLVRDAHVLEVAIPSGPAVALPGAGPAVQGDSGVL